MASDLVHYELDGHVATITLARPEVRNALKPEAYRQLEGAFHEAQRDPDVRCVVLTGSDPAFCSGDDVKELMTGLPDEMARSPRPVRARPTPAALAVLECDRPVIAAVNGPAVGWGMDLTLFCDIRIASERARFGELFVKRGLVADIGGLWRLPQAVGPSKAAELLFTGDVIDAAEAERIGLVNRVLPHDELLKHVQEYVRDMAANCSPTSLQIMKRQVYEALQEPLSEAHAKAVRLMLESFGRPDFGEGVTSYLQKRPPKFERV